MRILLVRLRLIGDVVFTTPVISALRRTYPDAHITYAVEPSAAPVVMSNPHLSNVLVLPVRRGWRRVLDDLRIGRRLRAQRFDLVIDLHGGPRSAWLTWATGAPVRVGYDVPGRSWMYTRVVSRPRTFRPRHAVENQWDLFSAAIDADVATAPDPERHPVEMTVDASSRSEALQKLQARGVPVDARVIVLHVSAGNPFRRWPEAAFATVAAGLATGADNRWVLISAGPSDRAAVTRVLDEARRQAGAAATRIVDAEGLSLTELRAVLDRSALFVGGDSGPLHVAATSEVPIVGLYGPTLPVRSAPWRPRRFATASVEDGPLLCRPCDQRVCTPGDFRCLTSIPAAQVLGAAERILEARR
ncbi:MAG: glycosyltransferase family 9 protein [Vicinamibacterales bacterium]